MPSENLPALVLKAGKLALQQTPRAQLKKGRKHLKDGLHELYDNRNLIEAQDQENLINALDELEEMGTALAGNTTTFLESLQHSSEASTFQKQAKSFQSDVEKSDEGRREALRRAAQNARSCGQGPSHTADHGAGGGQVSGSGERRSSARSPPISDAEKIQAIRDSIASARQREVASQQSPENPGEGSHQGPASQGSWISESALPVTRGNIPRHSPQNSAHGSQQSLIVLQGSPKSGSHSHASENTAHTFDTGKLNEPYGSSRGSSSSST